MSSWETNFDAVNFNNSTLFLCCSVLNRTSLALFSLNFDWIGRNNLLA